MAQTNKTKAEILLELESLKGLLLEKTLSYPSIFASV
jgi:hypothetical protein